MALSIKISSFVSAGYTGDLIRWRLKETGSGVYVDSHEEAGPHGTDYEFSFVNNIRDIVYTVEMYDVAPGAGVGELMKAHDITPSTTSLNLDSDLELIVGGDGDNDPVAGENSVVIPETIGKKYRVFQRGFGQLLRDREVEFIPDEENGGFALTGGQTFDSDDVYIVQFIPELITNPLGSISAGGAYKGIKFVDEDYTILSEDFGSLIIADGSGTVLTLTLPDEMPEGIPLDIQSIGTHNNNVVISGAIVFGGYTDDLILGKSEGCQILKLNGIIYGFSNSSDLKMRGEIDFLYSLKANRIWADGSVLNQSDYPGLLQRINRLSPAQVITTYNQWNSMVLQAYNPRETNSGAHVEYDQKATYPYRGLFAKYDDKIVVPDFRNKFVRALKSNGGDDDGRWSNIAGSYQIDSLSEHYHNPMNAKGGSIKHDGFNDITVTSGSGNVGLIIGKAGGTETRGENIGLIPAIII